MKARATFERHELREMILNNATALGQLRAASSIVRQDGLEDFDPDGVSIMISECVTALTKTQEKLIRGLLGKDAEIEVD